MVRVTRTANDNPPPWPTRPDGTAMTIGEMTKEQRDAQYRAAVRRVARDLKRTFGDQITIIEGDR